MTTDEHDGKVGWMDSIRRWAPVASAFGSVATAILFGVVIWQGSVQIDELERQRSIRTLYDVFQAWDSERMQDARIVTVRWVGKHRSVPLSSAPDSVMVRFQTVLDYLETLTYMVDRGMVEREHVDALMSPRLVQYWCIYEDHLVDWLGPDEGQWFRRFSEEWMQREGTSCESVLGPVISGRS